MTTDTMQYSRAQLRMLLQSLIGQRVRIAHTSPALLPDVIEVLGVAVEATGDRDRATTIVGRMCDEDNRYVVLPLASVRSTEPLEWYITDPRHPDYEEPVMVVRPTGAKR